MIEQPVSEADSTDDDDAPTSRYHVAPGTIEVVVVEKRARGEGADGAEEPTRLEVRLVVSVESESNFYIGFTENLSEGGVFVATHAPKRIGSTVDLVIVLPLQAPIHAKGTVRWVRPYQEPEGTAPGMGIRFDELSTDAADRIREFTQSRPPMFFDDDSVGLPEVVRV